VTATNARTAAMTTTMEHVMHVDAAPSAGDDLRTTVDGLCRWWGETAAADLRPGGSIRVDIDGELLAETTR